MRSKLNKLTVVMSTLLVSVLTTHSAHADWIYLGSYDKKTGVPKDKSNLSASIPADLLAKIAARLPEGQAIGKNPAALAMLTDDLGANLPLKCDARVKVSFVAEGAGYRNAVAFFNFNTPDLLTLTLDKVQDKIMFPNFSAIGSGGNLAFGDTVDLGIQKANTSVGFTVMANGWVGDKVNPSQSSATIFRTVKRFNPESVASKLNAHTVLLSDDQAKLLVLGIEDLNRQDASANGGYASDDDFNDAILAIHVDPWECGDTTKIPPLDPKTPPPVTHEGYSGNLTWREITAPETVEDPTIAAKAAAKALRDAQKAADKAAKAAGK